MQILAFANQKGGSGKTTSALAIANAANESGKKVLAIDLDPQCNFSLTLGADFTTGKNAFEMIENEEAAANNLQHLSSGIDVIAGSPALSTVSTGKGSARRLQASLKPLEAVYDVIVLDTPPTAGELQYNALQAATGLVITTAPDNYGLQGLYQIVDTAKAFKKSNKRLEITGCIITQYTRSRINDYMVETIKKEAEARSIPLLGTVRNCKAVKESQIFKESLFSYDGKSTAAQDYLKIAEQILQD